MMELGRKVLGWTAEQECEFIRTKLLAKACNPLHNNAERLRAYQDSERIAWISAVRFRAFPILAVPREYSDHVTKAVFRQ